MPRVPPEAEGPRAGFSCTRIPLSADPSAPVAKYFEQAATAVHAALSSHGKVLLCCAGDSTAAAAATAAAAGGVAPPTSQQRDGAQCTLRARSRRPK